MSRVSLILNTASMDLRVGAGHNPFRRLDYRNRIAILKETLDEAKKDGFDEIIVAGTFEAGDGYVYIPVQPRFRDRRDALHQREAGARHSTGDVLVFCHDDHRPGPDFCQKLAAVSDPWDLLIPKRVHFLTQETLNNGKAKNYMGGHCLAMKRWLWAEVPWTILNTEWWDVSLTAAWRDAGAALLWTDELCHYDMEALEHET